MKITDINSGQEVKQLGPVGFDDVLIEGGNVVHAEMMSEYHLWIGIHDDQKDASSMRVVMNVHVVDDGQLQVTVEEDGPQTDIHHSYCFGWVVACCDGPTFRVRDSSHAVCECCGTVYAPDGVFKKDSEPARRAEGWRPSPVRHKCANRDAPCLDPDTWVEEISDHPDYRIKCFGCGFSYKVDGPDA